MSTKIGCVQHDCEACQALAATLQPGPTGEPVAPNALVSELMGDVRLMIEHAEDAESYSGTALDQMQFEFESRLRAALAAAPQPSPAEIRRNEDGTLDEVVGTGTFQLEQMSDTCWFLELGGVRLFLNARGKIEATHE